MVNKGGQGVYYPGVITGSVAGHAYDIKYDDGGAESSVRKGLIKSETNSGELAEGSRVKSNYRGQGKYYPGVITRCIISNAYNITYDTGGSEMSVTQDRITCTQKDLELILNPLTEKSTSFILKDHRCLTCNNELVDMRQIPNSHTCDECRFCIPSTVFKRCEQCDYDLCSSFCTVSLCLLRENATSSIVFATHRHATFAVKLYTISDPDIGTSTCPFITRFASPKPPP
jgi:hypothetical protein